MKKTYRITTGDAFELEATSQEEAEALFFISQGYMSASDYPDYHFTPEELDSVKFIEADTIVEELRYV